MLAGQPGQLADTGKLGLKEQPKFFESTKLSPEATRKKL